MAQQFQESNTRFTQPITQILTMLVIVGLVGLGVFVLFARVQSFFLSNPILNGVILLVFAIGVLACFWQVLQLVYSVKWIEDFAMAGQVETEKAPILLAPLAALLGSRAQEMRIGASSARSILDSVATRIDEARDITRYIVNLLIFLGLLGTFYGLATTVPALVETIRSLANDAPGDGANGFARLMSGLEKQLGGMGTAFSSSLLGLAGSLLVGLLELFAGHGQNRFYRDLEEWLSSITWLGFSSGEGDGGEQSMVTGLLQHMSDQMEAMQKIYAHSDASRAQVDQKLGVLAVSVERLTDRMARDTGVADALQHVADGQGQLLTMLARQSEDNEAGAQADAESRMRLRSIDVQLLRILEEMSAGRQETTAELRADLRALTSALRDATDQTSGAGRG